MPPQRLFTLCALFYGDYPQLAQRFVDSLRGQQPEQWCSLRLFGNAAAPQTEEILRRFSERWPESEPPLLVFSPQNRYKYPAMRELFYSAPLTTPYVMWFDDDSFLLPNAPRDWFARVAAKMAAGADMIGSIWMLGLRGGQAEWVRSRPWYAGRPLAARHMAKFATGGWWTIRREILQRWNWPDLDLQHRGGDVMLGELCRQQGYRLEHFIAGLGINADDSGKCSSMARRGFDGPPVGLHFKP